jgi:hypothetical protein
MKALPFFRTSQGPYLATLQPIPHKNEFSTTRTPLWQHPISHWWHHFDQKVRPVLKRNKFYFKFQATLVKESVWQCRWVGAPFRQQRTLMFMMTAANQDLALTAGGFAPLSHHTMMTVRHSGTETLNSIRSTKCGKECSRLNNLVQAVPLVISTRKVPSPNLSQDTSFPGRRFCEFIQSLQANMVKTTLVKQKSLPSTSLRIHYSFSSNMSMV